MKKPSAVDTTAKLSAREWSRIVEQWRRSQQITSDFCRSRALTLKTFQWWRWALKSRGRHPHRRAEQPDKSPRRSLLAVVPAVQPPPPPAFIEVVPREARAALESRGSGVEIVLGGVRAQRRVKVDADFDTATLRRVVSLLEEV